MVQFCNRCEGRAHSNKPCPAFNQKWNTCEKARHFAKTCRIKTQPGSGKFGHHNNLCKEEGNLSDQIIFKIVMGMYYTRENTLYHVSHMGVR